MSMDLSVKTYSTAPQYFEAGTYPVVRRSATAAENIPAHAPVILNNSGKLEKITVPGENEDLDLTGLYGITPESIQKDEEGPVWLTGEYFRDAIVLPTGITLADVELPLRNIGIFLA